LVALAGIGLYYFTTTRPAAPDMAKATRAAPPQPVAVATIGTGDIRIVVSALGTVTPIATVTVKSRVSGHLLEVAFKEGQIVAKGDLLAQIDPRPFELARDQQVGQLMRDQGLLDQARTNLTRYQMLVKQNSIARQQAEDQAFVVKQYEGVVKTDIALIEAQKLNLTYARITAPIAGRIGLRLVDAGNYVQTTDTGIAVITQLHPISVIFNVPEDELPKIMAAIHAGRSLVVTAYDRANITPLAVGKLMTVDNQIDQTTGTAKVRADFENLDDRLFPNQFVNARLLVETLRDVVTVPTSAIQRGAPGTYAYVVESENIVAVRPVELGPADGGMIAVTSGLRAGDRVVVDGADRLRDGAKVIVPGDGAERPQAEGGRAQAAPEPGARRPGEGRRKANP
ncbi:MAG: MdtA/MuxA family multidrug efflux RND transporter periplasmic adaptor subunit, partial [Thermoanaerobaculia bacterium]